MTGSRGSWPVTPKSFLLSRGGSMETRSPWCRRWSGVFFRVGVLSAWPRLAAGSIGGRVTGAGAPIAGSTVTLWAATAGEPKQLAQARTDADGSFTLSADGGDASVYLVAKGGQPATAKTSGDNVAIGLLA